MKKVIYSIVILMMITIAISCKKNKAVSAPVSINGFWTGTGIETGTGTAPFSVKILYKDNNIVRSYGLSSSDTSIAGKYDGTYSIDTDSIRTTVVLSSSYSVYYTGKLNSTKDGMSGTYNYGTSSPFHGTFSINKN